MKVIVVKEIVVVSFFGEFEFEVRITGLIFYLGDVSLVWRGCR